MLARSTVLLAILLAARCAQGAAGGSGAPDGAAIFASHCAACHGERGEGVSGVVTIAGPSIQAVHEPGRVMMAMEVGPGDMPVFAYALSIREMRAVADFVTGRLAVIPLSGGDLAHGGKVFRIYCAPCHRTAVRGGALAYDGTNAPSLVHKSAALVAGAIRSGPGPMPRFSAAILDDHDVASIARYVTYVQHPPSPGGSPMQWYGPVAEGFVAWVAMLALIAVTGWIEKGGNG